MKIQRVNSKWFIGRVKGAAFFGQSTGELSMKLNDWLDGREVVTKPRKVQRPKLRIVKSA